MCAIKQTNNKEKEKPTNIQQLNDFCLTSGFSFALDFHSFHLLVAHVQISAHARLGERSTHVNAVFITFDKEEISVKIRSFITDG